MSKAVLVLDEMPDDCGKCPLHNYDDVKSRGCVALKRVIVLKIGQKKPDWCPLRPMPERVYYGKDCSEWDDGYQCGVAAALRAMGRSGEDKA